MTAQAQAALAQANVVRLAGAEVKRQLREGEVTLAEALDDPASGSLFVAGQRGILEAVPRWGSQAAARALAAIGVREHKRVRDLSARQRTVLGQWRP